MNSNIDRYQSPQDQTESEVTTLTNAGRRRSPTSPHRLDAESGRKEFHGYTLDQPIVSKDSYGGNYEEGITHLLTVGENLLAVSRGINRKKIGESMPIDFVRIAVLPVGIGDTTGKHSSSTILEVNLADLRRPDEKGVIQPFRDIEITRAQLAALTGYSDVTASSSHATIRVNEDGSINIYDHSTNGTQVFDQYDLNGSSHALDSDGELELLSLMKELQENPHRWERATSGRAVIEDAQG